MYPFFFTLIYEFSALIIELLYTQNVLKVRFESMMDKMLKLEFTVVVAADKFHVICEHLISALIKQAARRENNTFSSTN